MDLEIYNLEKSFGPKKALNSISLKINGPGIIGYLGPNGAGKTTTFKIISGLLRPSGGDVKVNGRSIRQNKSLVLSDLSCVIETPVPYPYLTVAEYLFFIGRLRGMSKEEISTKISSLQSIFRISNMEERCGNLSKGNQQRVVLMAAMIPEAEIMLLDEPTSGLDPIESMMVIDYLKTLRKKKLILVSSHLLHEVSDLCDDVVFIDRGNLLTRMSVDEIKEKFSNGKRSGIEEAYVRIIGGKT